MARRSCEVTITIYDSEDREVEVTATYEPGEGGGCYFDRNYGNYLPRDEACVEDVTAVAIDEGADVEDALKRNDIDALVAEKAREADEDAEADAAEMRAELAREERWDR